MILCGVAHCVHDVGLIVVVGVECCDVGVVLTFVNVV